MVILHSPSEIEAIRSVGRMAAATLTLVGQAIRPGMTTQEIDDIVRDDTLARGGTCAPLGYRGFPKHCCVSVNDVVCHGIPGNLRLREGDIVNVDVTTKRDGFHGDTSATFYVGDPSEEARRLVETARFALELGIAQVRPGGRVGDIGAAIQEYVEATGFSIVRDYVGHGIGREFHCDPKVPHYGTRGRGERLAPGMIFTIEPMVNAGDRETIEDQNDGWTIRTKDGKLSSQFEHTILVTEAGSEILTSC